MLLHIQSLERYCPPVWCLKHLLISLSCEEGHGNASWEIVFHQNLKCFKRDWNDSTAHTMKWDSSAYNESTKLKLQSPVCFNNYLKCMNCISNKWDITFSSWNVYCSNKFIICFLKFLLWLKYWPISIQVLFRTWSLLHVTTENSIVIYSRHKSSNFSMWKTILRKSLTNLPCPVINCP